MAFTKPRSSLLVNISSHTCMRISPRSTSFDIDTLVDGAHFAASQEIGYLFSLRAHFGCISWTLEYVDDPAACGKILTMSHQHGAA